MWSGTISFGLIAIPVKLLSAVRKKNVSFNRLEERNMARIRYRKVNAETGDEVTEEHIVKGYEVAKGRYVVVDPDELELFMPVATKSIDLEEFVASQRSTPCISTPPITWPQTGFRSPTSCLPAQWNRVAKSTLGA